MIKVVRTNLIDPNCEIFVAQYNTFRFQHEHENVYYVQVLSTIQKSLPSSEIREKEKQNENSWN